MTRQAVILLLCQVQAPISAPISARCLDAVVMPTRRATVSTPLVRADVTQASAVTENVAMVTMHAKFPL